MKLAPCKDCADREIGCHGWCERYNEWRRAKDADNAKKRRGRLEAMPFDIFPELWDDIMGKGKE